jgi:hypothetical protein
MTIFRPLATIATAILAGLADTCDRGRDRKKRTPKAGENRKKAEILAVSTIMG